MKNSPFIGIFTLAKSEPSQGRIKRFDLVQLSNSRINVNVHPHGLASLYLNSLGEVPSALHSTEFHFHHAISRLQGHVISSCIIYGRFCQ